MVLSDRTIREQLLAGRLRIDPIDEADIQPSSVDLHLSPRFQVFRNTRYPFIDPAMDQKGLMELVEASQEEPFVLHPGEFVLAATVERLTLPDDIVARLEGKSSLGRLGLLIHSTAGYIDPGWEGTITLELSNVANLPMVLTPGMAIGQVSFMLMTTPVDRPYGSPELRSRYQGQIDPTPSRSYLG
jgi:dCTP deaminase